jgi:peptidoglycan hydrolase-like protein with peptidoglycan-binding domain
MMVRSDQRRVERERTMCRGCRAAFTSQAVTLDEPSEYGTWRTDRPPIEPEVTELQLRLRQIGLYDGDADGDFDRRVENAVRGYQLTRFLLEDESGVYGSETRTSLEAETSQP